NAEKRWGTVVFNWRGTNHRFVKDNENHHIYNDDEEYVVRFKCLLLSAGTMVGAACRMIYHVAHLAIHTGSLPYHALQGNKQLVKTLAKVKLVASEILRAAAFGLLATAAALYGVILPYTGRRLYNYFERCLNRQTEHVDRKEKFYLAECFIPLNFNVAE